MKQSGHLNPGEETRTGSPVISKYGRTSPNKHGGVGRQQITHYYRANSLCANPDKTQVTAFNLRNKEAKL